MMPNWTNFCFVLEILLSELSLMFFYPKKKHFYLLYPSLTVLYCLGSLLIPSLPISTDNQFYLFGKYLFLFLLTIPIQFLSFKTPFTNLLSACGAGYSLQHIGHKITVLLLKSNLFISLSEFRLRLHMVELLVMPIVFVLGALTFGLTVRKNEYYRNKEKIFIFPPLVSLFICLVLNRVAFLEGVDPFSISLSCYAITCCLLCLFLQYYVYDSFSLKNEKNTMAVLYQKDKELYEIKKKDIELLNIKYHDMKKRLREMEKLTPEEVSSLKDIMKVYSTHYKTGCEVLDNILMDKTSSLMEEKVEITFMGDASSLNAMDAGDCYSLFENILSNAIEAVSRFREEDRKTIGLQVSRKGRLTVINCYNYYQGTLKMTNGLPETTKKEEEGFHGYGMKSIKLICEKYQGGMNIKTLDQVFDLSLYLLTA